MSSTLPRTPLKSCAVLLVFASACAKPEAPRVTPRQASVVGVDPAGLHLGLELDVYNPNAFPLLVNNVTGTLTLSSGAELGSGRAEPHGSIPSKGSSVVASQLDIAWQNVAALAPFALSAQPVPYTFRGIAAIGGDRLNVDVPFVLQGQLTREELLRIGLPALGNGVPGLPR